MFKNLALFFIMLSSNAQASYLNISCGEYKARGLVQYQANSFSLLIFPKSKSEITLNFSYTDGPKLAPFINRYVRAQVKIKKQIQGLTKIDIDEINNIIHFIPNLLENGNETGLDLIKSKKCN